MDRLLHLFRVNHHIAPSTEALQYAIKKAQWVNHKYQKDAVPPIFAEKILLKEGIVLEHQPLAKNLVAVMQRSEKRIVLTDDKVALTKWGNFAIAHALGHWFLHTHEIAYFSPLSLEKPFVIRSEEDNEANYFASYLLLPEQMIQEWNWLPKRLFSSAFEVPEEVIIFRFHIARR